MKSLGYTKVPDIIIDEVMQNLSGSEFKILIFIIRKTIGWNKKRDRLTHGQFLKTGIKFRSISSAICSLEEKKLIEVTDEKGNTLYPQQRKQESQIYYSCGKTLAKIALPIAINASKPSQKLRITIDTNNTQKKEVQTRRQTDRERLIEILHSQQIEED